MKGVSVMIEGRVQGVGFRFSTKQKATELDLAGFVKNMPDGSVYAEAFGKEDQIDQFIQWCQQGNSFSRVTNVNYSSIPFENHESFKISH